MSVTLSPDGKWMAYALHPVEGDGELIIRRIRDTMQRSFPIGAAPSFSISFSENSQFLAFKEFPKDRDRKASQRNPQGKPLSEKLHLLDLNSWKKTEFEKVGQYAFNNRGASSLAVQIMRDRSPGPIATPGADLLMYDLASGQSYTVGNIGEFEFNRAGTHLAYTIDAANNALNAVHVMENGPQRVSVIDHDKASYKSLGWNEEGTALALLKFKKEEKYTTESGVVLGVDFSRGTPSIVRYDPKVDSLRFPVGMTVSPNRRPVWTDDLKGILFGIHKHEPVRKERDMSEKKSSPGSDSGTLAAIAALKQDTSIKTLEDLQRAMANLGKAKGNTNPSSSADTIKPDMTIWHWQDKVLQSSQQVRERALKTAQHLAFLLVDGQRFIRLQDSSLTEIQPLKKHLYALAEDNRDYELKEALDGQSYTDYHVVNMRTGERELFRKGFYAPSFTSVPNASWDGNKLVYGENGHFHVYDIPTRKHTNITSGIPTSFINTEDDHNVKDPLTPVIGWSSDSRYLLIRDLWDIWLVSADGKEAAVNLTVNGKRDKIRYQSRISLSKDEKGFDPRGPLYVRMYGEWTKKSGYAVIEPDKKGLKAGARVLLWEDANLSNLRKAEKAEIYIYSAENHNKPPQYYVADRQLSQAVQVCENAPDFGKYSWSSGARLINYVSEKGDSLQGALFLPANYEEGKRYPTLVYYYEKLSQTLHNWSQPGFSGTGWNPGIYTSNGYAVFIPDIVYKLDDPGMSAVWCVLPAVKAAIATGVIDADRIGIHGHSWGGYQTCFLVTQTPMFRAAAAGAPLTNMVSMYDLIYWNTGGGNGPIFEASQGRFRGAPWEDWDAYLRNSPVYHVKEVSTPLLMLHNDKDGAVDFTQGIEFYNALRRLQKPVVLIQYKGENHGLAKMENRKDYSVRMLEFFDHHLKGATSADWLRDGISRLKLEEHLNPRVFGED